MKKNIHIAILFLMFCVFLSACGKKQKDEIKITNGEFTYVDEPVNVYSAMKYSAQTDKYQNIYVFDTTENAMYYVVLTVDENSANNESQTRLYRLDYDKLATADEKLKKEYGWTNESETDILSLSKDITPQVLLDKHIGNIYCYDGKIYALVSVYNDNTESYDSLVYCIDESKETELVCDITEGRKKALEAASESIEKCSSSYDSFSVHETEKGLICFLPML